MYCLHLITDLDVGGAETMLARLITHMDGRFRNTVVSLTDVGPVGEQLRASGIPVHALGMSPSLSLNPAPFLRLYRLLRALRPDLLQGWLYHANLVGLVVGRLAGVPRIAWNLRSGIRQPGLHRRGTAWMARASALLSRWPDVVLVNSASGLEFHRRLGYRPRRWELVPNGFEIDRFLPNGQLRAEVRREVGVPESGFLIGHIGRFHPAKGHDILIRAAGLLAGARPEAFFALCGEGVTEENPQLERWIEEAGLRGRVRLLGPRRDIPRLLVAFDAMTSASLSEGFPNVVGEAMACGIPCVVTDVGDSKTLVGESGLTVPAGRPEALASALETMIRLSPEARGRLGEAARRRIETHYEIGAIARRVEALYDALLGGSVTAGSVPITASHAVPRHSSERSRPERDA